MERRESCAGSNQQEFGRYLRTGRSFSPIEVKFNPYHDPYNGRFTFAPGGPARSAAGAARRSHSGVGRQTFSKNDPRHSENYAVYRVGRGDTLGSIAKRRRGLTVEDLKWLNGMKSDALRVGQAIRIPHQAFLDAGREAKNRFVALDYYMRTHGSRLPPNVAHPPSLAAQLADPATWHRVNAKGYAFDLDDASRTRRVSGTLRENPSQGRSRSVQRAAGGRDRLPGDEGGHYVARRFDGPTEAFNHFAQDGNFNKSGYLRLENRWAAAQKLGKKVYVRITPGYDGLSLRPTEIDIFYNIDDAYFHTSFPNKTGAK